VPINKSRRRRRPQIVGGGGAVRRGRRTALVWVYALVDHLAWLNLPQSQFYEICSFVLFIICYCWIDGWMDG